MPSDSPVVTMLEARDQFDNALQTAWIRGSAQSTPLSLLLVCFDKPETPIGISLLERALRVHCARTHDVCLRRSHDEFGAVLPDTPPAGARRVGEQILEAMRAEDADHMHRVSIGVAVAVPDEHRDPSDLLRRAEASLEAAQSAGGDRCVGGAAAAVTAVAKKPPGVLSTLGGIFKKKESNAESRRRTD